MAAMVQRVPDEYFRKRAAESEDVRDDDNLMDLGLDSMRAMNLVVKWEEAGVPLDFTDLAEAMTLAGLWAALGARLKGD